MMRTLISDIRDSLGHRRLLAGTALVVTALSAAAFFALRPLPLGPGSSSHGASVIPAFKPVPELPNTAAYPADAPPLRITEVFLGSREIWAELYCARGTVDLSRYRLSDLDGEEKEIADEPATLKAGEFAVVRWGEGFDECDAVGDANGNGIRDFYLGTRSARGEPYDKAPSRTVDQLVLIRVESGRTTMEEAVAWALPDRRPEEWEADDYNLITGQNLWTGDCLEVSENAEASWTLRSLARRGTPEAWALTGVPTPGIGTDAANIPAVGSLRFTEVHPMADRKEAFVEIHCERTAPAAGVNLRSFVVSDLHGVASPLAAGDLILKPGEYAVVHWGVEGTTEIDNFGDRDGSGFRDIYLPAAEAAARTEAVLTLSLGGQIYDAVSWIEQGRTSSEQLTADLARLRGRGFTLQPFVLSGPETLLGRADGAWFITSVASPGSGSRLATAPAKGEVTISEVYPNGAASWAEIEVTSQASAEGVDVSLFVLTDLDGRGEPIATDPLTLKPGERLLVRWGEGVDEVDAVGDVNGNGIREVFLNRSNPPASTTDQMVLLFGMEVHDALAWRIAEAAISTSEQQDLTFLASSGLRVTPIVREANSSIGRWNGRVMAFADPTPAIPNDHYLSRPFGQVRISAFQASRGLSWVEVDCVRGPTDISRLIATDLDDQDQPLSEKSITLRRGERARITWGKGPSETDDIGDANGNGVRDVFLDEDAPTKSGDQIVLIHNGRWLDAVVFADQSEARFSYPEQKDVKALVDQGLWQAPIAAFPDAVVTGGGISRRTGRAWTAQGA